MEQDETVAWSIRSKKSFRRRVVLVAKEVDQNASQLIRLAVNKEIERLARSNPRVARILQEEQAESAAA